MTDQATTCGACGEKQMRLQYSQGGHEAHPACHACGHQPSMQVYRENRLEDLLPPRDDWPDESGVRWSENLPDTPEGEEGAVLLVLGPREWDSLASRTSLTFHEQAEVEVVKGRGPGVGFTHDDGDVGTVTVDLPGPAIRELHDTGHWGASVGPETEPVHLRVVVQADA